MRHKLIACFCVLLSVGAQKKGTPMTNQLLSVKVKCKGNDRCLFEGQDLLLDIFITNNQSYPIGYPLAYRQKTGPTIRLIDVRTKAEAQLKTNLADPALREDFTEIAPGKSAILGWVITSGEIEQFNGPKLDLLAEVTLRAEIQVHGNRVEFTGTDSFRIEGKGKP
jgi:hypothetical protein